MIPVMLTGLSLIVIGAVWWRRVGVGAERPASLLVVVGVGISIAAWWLP